MGQVGTVVVICGTVIAQKWNTEAAQGWTELFIGNKRGSVVARTVLYLTRGQNSSSTGARWNKMA